MISPWLIQTYLVEQDINESDLNCGQTGAGSSLIEVWKHKKGPFLFLRDMNIVVMVVAALRLQYPSESNPPCPPVE